MLSYSKRNGYMLTTKNSELLVFTHTVLTGVKLLEEVK